MASGYSDLLSPAAVSAGDASEVTAPITLLYVRSPDIDLTLLDARLAKIAARYAPLVEMRIVQQSELAEYNLPCRYADFDGLMAAVLVLRHGEIVGEAIGASLPIRELDRVVRCAVEWS